MKNYFHDDVENRIQRLWIFPEDEPDIVPTEIKIPYDTSGYMIKAKAYDSPDDEETVMGLAEEIDNEMAEDVIKQLDPLFRGARPPKVILHP